MRSYAESHGSEVSWGETSEASSMPLTENQRMSGLTALLFRLVDINLPETVTSRSEKLVRRGLATLSLCISVTGPVFMAIYILTGFRSAVAMVFYAIDVFVVVTCAVSLARGKKASLGFLQAIATVNLSLLFVAFVTQDILNADSTGSNFGMQSAWLTATSFYLLPNYVTVPFFFMTGTLTAVRASFGTDLSLLTDDEQVSFLAPIFNSAITIAGLIIIAMLAFVTSRIMADIDRAEAKEEAMKEKLQAIKLKTGYRDDEDDERVELAAERVMDVLRQVRSSLRSKHPDRKRLAKCIDLIASNKLYDADTHHVKDKETANWLDDLLEVDKTKRSRNASLAVETVRPGQPELASIHEGTQENAQQLTSDVRAVLRDLPNWSFDVWRLADVTGGKPLAICVNRILELKGTFGKLKMDRARVDGYLRAVEDAYLAENPYHNAVHGADVSHALFVLIDTTGLSKYISPLENMACVLAAAMHDVKHPGVNNNYLSRTLHPLAFQYNDKAILENMHASEGLKLAFSEQHDVFGELGDADRKHVRKMIIELVLATDMTRHFELINQFKTTLSSGPPTGVVKEETQFAMLRIAMKMADVSNPAKPVDIAVKWTERVIEEFFSQGDQERAAGLDISPFMDRRDTDIPKTQVGFISFMITPLFAAFHDVFPIDEQMKCLGAVKEHWSALEKANPQEREADGDR